MCTNCTDMNPSENWTNRFFLRGSLPIVCKVLKYKYEHILSCRRSRKRFLKESISIWAPHHIFVELYNLSEGTKTEISWVTVKWVQCPTRQHFYNCVEFRRRSRQKELFPFSVGNNPTQLLTSQVRRRVIIWQSRPTHARAVNLITQTHPLL